MDRTLEKIAEEKLSVAHCFRGDGDMMRDPEVVFEETDSDWTPNRFR